MCSSDLMLKRVYSEGVANIKADGTRISANSAYNRFKEILEKCGISHLGHNQGPRLHDIRHTFAVHSLQHMVESGLDIYTALPILSVLLGHSSIYATENYVRLTIQLFPDIVTKNGPDGISRSSTFNLARYHRYWEKMDFMLSFNGINLFFLFLVLRKRTMPLTISTSSLLIEIVSPTRQPA